MSEPNLHEQAGRYGTARWFAIQREIAASRRPLAKPTEERAGPAGDVLEGA